MKRDLLDPRVQDTLPLVGVGLSAQVRRAGPWAVKIAHPGAAFRARLAREAEAFAALSAPGACPDGLFVPRFRELAPDRSALVRAHLALPRLLELLTAPGAKHRPVWERPFVECLRAAREASAALGFTLDFSPANLFWDATTRRFWLADLGERLDHPLFDEVAGPGDVEGALAAYLRWRERGRGAGLLARPAMPPSGRFHVETPVGHDPKAKLVWRNRAALARRGIDLGPRELMGLVNHVTDVEPAALTLPSTRYQDSPGTGEGHARGDGRAVVVGRIPSADLDLMVKGCGPTALAWTGNRYHEDGLVSFPRTLWETAICDELTRLGFDSPEVLCVATIDRVTVDNTERSWPAAAALRASRTIYRLGHLTHFSDDDEAFAAILRHVGREALRADFSPNNRAHLRQLVRTFADNLGRDVGRTDVLNIHGFNPTLGNVRIDGHLIDFSTVRFLRYYLPDFQYMNDTRRVREHVTPFKRHPGVLVDALARAGLLDAPTAREWRALARRTYEAAVHVGHARGFMRYLGLPEDEAARLGPRLREDLYRVLRRVRLHRAEHMLRFDFWKQEVLAPLFDVGGRIAELLDALDDDHAPAALASPFCEAIGKRAEHDARALVTVLKAALRRLPEVTRPRRWDQIVRPFMAAERLADLCYRRSVPERFGAYQRLLATSAALAEGTYDANHARAEARRLGHVELEPPLGGPASVVVGLMPELADGLAQLLEDLVDDAFIAAIAHGPRVSPKGRVAIVEAGCDLEHTTPLEIAVLTRPLPAPEREALADALARAAGRLGALMPLSLTLVPVEGERHGRSVGPEAEVFARAAALSPDALRVLCARGQRRAWRARCDRRGRQPPLR